MRQRSHKRPGYCLQSRHLMMSSGQHSKATLSGTPSRYICCTHSCLLSSSMCICLLMEASKDQTSSTTQYRNNRVQSKCTLISNSDIFLHVYGYVLVVVVLPTKQSQGRHFRFGSKSQGQARQTRIYLHHEMHAIMSCWTDKFRSRTPVLFSNQHP